MMLFKAMVKPTRFIGKSLVVQGLAMLAGKATFYTHITLTNILWVTILGVFLWAAGNLFEDWCAARLSNNADPPRRT